MFESLSEKLQGVFKKLRSRGGLTEAEVNEALREVRLVMLEADVNFKVVKDFVTKVRARLVGADVLEALSPAQHIIKIVNEELVEVLGGARTNLTMASQPPTVIMLVGLNSGANDAARVESDLRATLPFPPLEVHSLADELQKTGSDMFIFLALEDMRIYLIGGLILALIGMVAVATANYMEEQHTLALLRIRGAAPRYIWRYLMAMIISPALLGLLLGGVSALIAECDRDLGHDATLQMKVDRCLDLLRRDLVPVPLSHREFYPGTPSHART